MKSFDPLGALQSLTQHRVEFVLIGGLAARLRGSPTVTDDLDVCHSKDGGNLENLAEALASMNARLRGAEDVDFILDARSLKTGENFTFLTDFGPLDCMARPAGVEGFAELGRNADVLDLDGITVAVASIEDLIRMKRAAGRPQDLIELEVLGALLEETEGNR